MLTPTHYEVLGVSRSATKKHIKVAYLKLLRKHNRTTPRNPVTSATKQLLNQANVAFNVLSDPQKRNKYNKKLAQWLNETPPPTSLDQDPPNMADNPTRNDTDDADYRYMSSSSGTEIEMLISGWHLSLNLLDHGASTPYGPSRTNLQIVVRFLGYEDESPESAVVTASYSGKKNDAILLLRLGVNPIHVSREWYSRHSTGAEVIMPPHLKIWADAMTEHNYGTISELVNEITADCHLSFDSITWEWDLSTILGLDVETDVVLMCEKLRTEDFKNTGRVHALTYQEYLGQCKRVDFVMELLDLLSKAKLDPAHQGFSVCAMRDPLVSVTCSHTNVSISFGNKQTCLAAFDLIEVVDWLCKTIHAPSIENGHRISSSTYHLERYVFSEDSEDATIKLYALRASVGLKTSPLPDFEHDCWLSLFDSCVVVEVPSTSLSQFGKGLESSFDLMIALAAAEFCLNINGVLVFLGYQTVLYPVEIDGKYAQFHLITINDGQINPYTLDLKNGLPGNDPSQFKKMRCFIGWCEVAHINLGTRKLPTVIGYSGGRDQSRSREPDGYAILGQVGASAPLSAIMGLQKNFRYNNHRIRFTPTRNYLKLLHDTSRQSVVLYDASQHRCWLVPKLSVLLHMSQRYTSQYTAAPNDQIPYVEPHADAMEIVDTLASAGQKVILEEQANKFIFRELMFALRINLLHTAEAVIESKSGKLYGFEFMDVVHEPGNGTCMKRLNINSKGKTWFELVNEVGTVILCSGLGEAISAVERNKKRKSNCNKLPQGEDLLAATIPCLSRLAEQRGEALGARGNCIRICETAVWKLTQNPFRPCSHKEADHETCWERSGLRQHIEKPTLIQQMARLLWSDPPPTQPTITIPTNGAVVVE